MILKLLNYENIKNIKHHAHAILTEKDFIKLGLQSLDLSYHAYIFEIFCSTQTPAGKPEKQACFISPS